MNAPLTDYQKRQSLPWVFWASVLNAFFFRLALTTSILVLFLSEVGFSKGRIGVLLSLLPFCGLLALFVAPWCARTGFKRVFLVFYGLRKFIILLLLLVPWVLSSFGLDATFVFVAAVLLAFAACRAVGETAQIPWSQEYIPASVRGRFSAIANVGSGLSALLAIGVASAVLDHYTGLNRYLWLIALATLVGMGGVVLSGFVPGGEPEARQGAGERHIDAMAAALRDRTFRLFTVGMMLQVLGIMVLTSFLPLFMKEQVGLTSARVVLLEGGFLIGGLITIGLWGWATDRYGSKPVLVTTLWVMTALPILWTFMPRNSPLSFPVAMAGACVFGAASVGLMVSRGTLLFNRVVPSGKRTPYMALYYATFSLMAAAGPLLSGRLLEQLQTVTDDPYVPLFVLGLALLYLALHVTGRIPRGEESSTRAFIGMFFHGNPFTAAVAMAGHSSVRHEQKRVATARRMGEIKSPLNEKEVLELLEDPSLNVRVEAIVAITSMRPSPALVDALVRVLDGRDPELSQSAAWALGRLGDIGAVPSLRSALESRYPGVRRASARALGMLGDRECIPLLIRMMEHRWNLGEDEPKTDAHTAASALGALCADEALGAILDLLDDAGEDDEMVRIELSLAIARMFGRERQFVSVWRRQRQDADASLAAAAARIKKNNRPVFVRVPALGPELDGVIGQFAAGKHAEGARALSRLVAQWPPDSGASKGCVLEYCAARLETMGADHMEFVLLALALLQ